MANYTGLQFLQKTLENKNFNKNKKLDTSKNKKTKKFVFNAFILLNEIKIYYPKKCNKVL